MFLPETHTILKVQFTGEKENLCPRINMLKNLCREIRFFKPIPIQE